jgi:sortase A
MGYTYTHGVKQKKRKKLIVFLLCLIVVSAGIIAAKHAYDRLHPNLHEPAINYSLPVRIRIPKLQVDSRVIYEGLTEDGHMSVPTNVIDTGWYKYSALPGNTGTAVIAGHLDGLRGEPGVFSDLDKLVKGDEITVTENNGLAVSFTVRETRSYPQNEQPSEVFNSSSGAHLNLITCTGSWNSSEHRFAERLVVFADKSS